MKTSETDWSRYETVPFAIFIKSAVTGWIEAARPTENPFKRYEAFDGPKMLLNFGLIVAETDAEFFWPTLNESKKQ